MSPAGRLAPSRGVVSWLAGAHVLRGAATATVPLVLSILALGGVTITGLFGGASRAVGADIAALERGADLRAVLGGPPAGGMPALPDLGTSTTITGSSPAWVDETAMVGDVPVKLVSAPVDRLGAAAALPAGLSLPSGLADHEPPGPLQVPDGARELTVRLTGGLDLDPWQLAAARQLPELGRRQAEAPYVVDPVATARDLTRDELERLRVGADARVEVLIRDTSTGISRRIPAVDLAVGGLDLVWGDTVEARPGRIVAAEGTVTLPESGTHVVDGLLLRVSGGPAGATVRLTVAVSADGMPLRPGASWTSDVAVPEAFAGPYRRLMAETPVEVGLTETVSDGGLAGVAVATNRPDVPPLLTSTAEGWQVVGEPWALSTRAILAADAVGAAARREATARLRALGEPDRDIRLCVVWETAPGLLFAVASGIGLGIGAAALLLGWLDYGFMTGARRARLALDPVWLATVLGLVLVALAAVITTAARRAAREGEAP